MKKQANRKVPQKRMCLRSLQKKAWHGMDTFGSACARAALILSLAAGALALPSAAFPVMAETTEAAASVTSVEYDNLEQLVQNNRNLKNALDNYTSNKETFENMLKTLEDERDYMKFMQEKYEDEPETKATYKMNASMLNMSISQITKQLEAQESKTQTTSRQKTIDGYVLTAQSLMRTYNQMTTKAQAEEKNYQAAQSSYQATLKKQSAGMATAADVMAAADTMNSAKNSMNLTGSRHRMPASICFLHWDWIAARTSALEAYRFRILPPLMQSISMRMWNRQSATAPVCRMPVTRAREPQQKYL